MQAFITTYIAEKFETKYPKLVGLPLMSKLCTFPLMLEDKFLLEIAIQCIKTETPEGGSRFIEDSLKNKLPLAFILELLKAKFNNYVLMPDMLTGEHLDFAIGTCDFCLKEFIVCASDSTWNRVKSFIKADHSNIKDFDFTLYRLCGKSDICETWIKRALEVGVDANFRVGGLRAIDKLSLNSPYRYLLSSGELNTPMSSGELNTPMKLNTEEVTKSFHNEGLAEVVPYNILTIPVGFKIEIIQDGVRLFRN